LDQEVTILQIADQTERVVMSKEKLEDPCDPEVVKQEMEQVVERLRDRLAEIHQTELPVKEDSPGEVEK
jgi:hypothetical protein